MLGYALGACVVIVWIIPSFGLFVSSLRDKDLLAISGWWTSLTTTKVNEIYRMSGMEDQIKCTTQMTFSQKYHWEKYIWVQGFMLEKINQERKKFLLYSLVSYIMK